MDPEEGWEWRVQEQKGIRKQCEKRYTAESGSNSEKMDKGGKNWPHHMLLFSKRAFFPYVNRVLEEEELGRAQKVSEMSNRRSSLNADKAGTSRSVIMSLCSITTEEKNYINY